MSSHEEGIPLVGLAALNPLAYLATLGCLSAATDECLKRGLAMPTLAFEFGARVRPILHGPFEGVDALLDLLVNDLDLIAGRKDAARDPFLNFEYELKPGKLAHDLKPSPELFRRFAKEQVQLATPNERRAVDWASSVLTDVAVDSKGACKPFALHFTAGQQQFLKVARELLDGSPVGSTKGASRRVDRDDLNEAVSGPWLESRSLKVFCWSPAQERLYALRSSDPSKDEKTGTPGADWLALRGLPLLSSAPVRDRIETSGVHGRWKDGEFSFPIWKQELRVGEIQSLLRHPGVCSRSRQARLRYSANITLPRGVEILTCGITRSEPGGYGSFSNARRV
jgi:hypothetical protein